jgi:hypothetical protein
MVSLNFMRITNISINNEKNLCKESVPEHCIKIPSQPADEFALSCRVETQKDLPVQFGWQFAMMMARQINGYFYCGC